jgi:molybdate/tungstate transport system substrate-binding protein
VNRRGLFVGFGATLMATTGMARAQESISLEVAYAGSMSSIMEGPLKRLAAKRLHIDLQGRAQGATGLAQLIAGETISPDVFIAVTSSPIELLINAGKTNGATAIGRTEMVIAYGPTSPFAHRLGKANDRGAEPWWQVLEERDVRIGRADPLTDPSGRNTIYLIQLAAKLYNQPDLVTRILGSSLNPRQIFSEATIEARLQSGQLDAASVYKVQPTAFGLPFVSLPSEINLGDARRAARYASTSLTLGGKTWRPEPLVYYAAVLKDAARPREAHAFVKWLSSAEVQALFRRYGYGAVGNAAPPGS